MSPTSCPKCHSMLTTQEAAGRTCPLCGAVLSGEGSDQATAPPPLTFAAAALGPKPARPVRAGTFTLVAAILALVFSLAALAFSAFNDPFGIALWGYDFSTPEATLVSQQKLEHNGDIRAMIAYQKKVRSPRAGEMLKTLKVEETVAVKKAQLVFFTYKYKDKTYYDMMAFTQDPESKWWRSTYVSEYSDGVSEELRKKIQEWRKKGPPPSDDVE